MYVWYTYDVRSTRQTRVSHLSRVVSSYHVRLHSHHIVECIDLKLMWFEYSVLYLFETRRVTKSGNVECRDGCCISRCLRVSKWMRIIIITSAVWSDRCSATVAPVIVISCDFSQLIHSNKVIAVTAYIDW